MKRIILAFLLLVSGVANAQNISTGTDTCSSVTEGIIRYNNTKNNHEGCVRTNDGWEWANMNGTLLDITPGTFSFTAQTNVNTNTLITSNSATVSGFDGPLTASCTNCTAIARNGVWGGTIVTGFAPNDTIAVRMTSSSSYNTMLSATVNLGITSATWNVTTKVQDTTPDAFTLNNITNSELNTTHQSNVITLAGVDPTITISCPTCTNIARNGTWQNSTSVIGYSAGDTFMLRGVSSGSYSTAVNYAYSVGATNGTWSITSRALDTTPNAFSFTNQTRVSPSNTTTSNAVSVSGFDNSLTATCTSCTAIARNGNWGGTSVSGFVPGDTIAVRTTSSSSPGGIISVGVTLGSTSTTWSVTTLDNSVAGLSFPTQNHAYRSTNYTSGSATISNFDGPLLMSVSGSGSPTFSVNSGSFVTSANVNPGDSIQVRLTSASSYGSSATATVSVGVSSGTYTVNNGTVSYGGWGGWGGCSVSCGGGTQYNYRSCNFSGGGTVSCSDCGGYCTDTSSCNTHSCYYYYWNYNSWGGCDASCDGGWQYRSVWCERSDGASVSDGFCSGGRPSQWQQCNTHSCCASNIGGSCTWTRTWSDGYWCPSGFTSTTCEQHRGGSIDWCSGSTIQCSLPEPGTIKCNGSCGP